MKNAFGIFAVAALSGALLAQDRLTLNDTEYLQKTGARICAAIKSGDTRTVFAYFSRKGVIWGIDGARLKVSELRKEFREKRGAYCFLFDSACLKKEDELARQDAQASPGPTNLLSLQDQLKGGGCAQNTHPPTGDAAATLTIRCPEHDEVEVYLVLEKTGWRITSIQYF